MLEAGLVYYLNKEIDFKGDDPEVLQEYLILTYNIFTMEYMMSPGIKHALCEFEETGGVETLNELTSHPNVTIAELAKTLIDTYFSETENY